MSHANVDLVQNLYAAFLRGDVLTIVRAMDPNGTWESVGRSSDFPTLGVRKGRGEVQSFFDAVSQHEDFSDFSPKEFHAVGDKVFVLGHYAMTVKKTGKPIASDWIHIFTIRGGQVAAFREFTDTAKLAEAYRG
jgi:ketosteroid isomerase-like protein